MRTGVQLSLQQQKAPSAGSKRQWAMRSRLRGARACRYAETSPCRPRMVYCQHLWPAHHCRPYRPQVAFAGVRNHRRLTLLRCLAR